MLREEYMKWRVIARPEMLAFLAFYDLRHACALLGFEIFVGYAEELPEYT